MPCKRYSYSRSGLTRCREAAEVVNQRDVREEGGQSRRTSGVAHVSEERPRPRLLDQPYMPGSCHVMAPRYKLWRGGGPPPLMRPRAVQRSAYIFQMLFTRLRRKNVSTSRNPHHPSPPRCRALQPHFPATSKADQSAHQPHLRSF